VCVRATGTIGVDFALKSIEWGHNSMVHLQLWDIAGTPALGGTPDGQLRVSVCVCCVA
jgi:hypothetical protein